MPGVVSKNIDGPAKEEGAEQKQAALAFPEHPSRATESLETDGNTQPEVLPTPNWEMWKTRGACRIWKAVLISMAVKPTSTVLKRLKKEQPLRYAEYMRRKKDVVAQYGLHPELQVAKHLNEGEKPGEQYIKLRGLLNFAKEYRWKDLDAFEQGMKLSAAASRAHSLFDALPQGQRDRSGRVRPGRPVDVAHHRQDGSAAGSGPRDGRERRHPAGGCSSGGLSELGSWAGRRPANG